MSLKQLLKKCLKFLILFIVIIAITEGVFTLKNDSELFVESENPELLKLNRDFTAQFSPRTIGYQDVKTIKKVKEKDIYRIFIVGETLNPDIPNNPNASFAHILNLKLQRTFRAKNIELINIVFNSASSFEMLKVVKQLKNYDPNLVILCPGRNEFYGKNTYPNNVLSGNEKLDNMIHCSHLYQAVRGSFSSKAEKFEIETAGAIFRKTIELFEIRLDKMVLNLQNSNIPVILINASSNLLDVRPQKSHFSSPYAIQLQKLFNKGKKAFEETDFDQASSCFSRIYKKDMTHAETLYYLGKLALKENNLKSAGNFFRQAADTDLFKLRVPSEVNNVIFRIATIRGCQFIDLEKLLHQNSIAGISGNDVFLDASHLNLKGNLILANQCMQSLLKEELMGKYDVENKTHCSDLALTAFDTIYDEYSGSLFANTRSEVATSYEENMVKLFANREITWEESMNNLYEYYIKNKNYRLAFKIIENLVLENPYNVDLNDKASKTASILSDSQLVVHYASRVYKTNPDAKIAERLFISYLKLDQPESALPFIALARNNKLNICDYDLLYNATNEIIVLKKLLRKNPKDIHIRHKIAQQYFLIGNEDVARLYEPNQDHNLIHYQL